MCTACLSTCIRVGVCGLSCRAHSLNSRAACAVASPSRAGCVRSSVHAREKEPLLSFVAHQMSNDISRRCIHKVRTVIWLPLQVAVLFVACEFGGNELL